MLLVLLWVSPVMGATYSKITYKVDKAENIQFVMTFDYNGKTCYQKIGALDPNDPYFTAI